MKIGIFAFAMTHFDDEVLLMKHFSKDNKKVPHTTFIFTNNNIINHQNEAPKLQGSSQ